MKKTLLIFFILATAMTLGNVFPPVKTADAQIKEYQTLENLPGVGTSVSLGEDTFTKYLNSAFKIGITVAILLAIIMMVIGGIEYMGSDSVFAKGAGKDKIEQALWGLALALGIFLLLNTINPDLVKLKLKIDRAEPAGTQAPRGGAPATTPSTVDSDNQLKFNAIAKDEANARAKLKAVGVGVTGTATSDPCKEYGQKGCTTVGLLPTTMITFLGNLKKSCNCNVVVTGGTEWWNHSPRTKHGPNNPVVDLGKNSSGEALSSYIHKVSPEKCSNIGETCTIRTSGLIVAKFFNEDTAHWHVTMP